MKDYRKIITTVFCTAAHVLTMVCAAACKDEDIPAETSETTDSETTTVTSAKEPDEQMIAMRQRFMEELGDEDANWNDSPGNDYTGTFRVLTFSSDIQIGKELACEYKDAFITSHMEIHFIVNRQRRETTKLSVLGNLLFVSVYEYVDNEEDNISLLAKGKLIKEFIINPGTGDVIVDKEY